MFNDLDYSDNELEIVKINMDNIPSKIFDIHSHIFLQEHISQGLFNNLLYTEFSNEDLNLANSFNFPGKNIENICFGQPQPDSYCVLNNNKYINQIDKHKFVLYDKFHEKDIKYELQHNNNRLGLKLYCFDSKSIMDNISFDMLCFLNKGHFPILLHLPNNVIYDYNEIRELAGKFPNIFFIFPHGGNVQKCYNNTTQYKETLNKIFKLNNIGFDVSGINSEGFIKILLSFDLEKIFYGSDFPITLFKGIIIPGKNGKMRLITNKNYYPIDYEINNLIIRNLNINFSGIVNALQYNIKLLWENLSEVNRDKIFYDNAKNIFLQSF